MRASAKHDSRSRCGSAHFAPVAWIAVSALACAGGGALWRAPAAVRLPQRLDFPPPDFADPSVDELMSLLQARYKQGDKKYATLADEIEKEVRKALASTLWLSEHEAGRARLFAEHPFLALVEQLSKAAQVEVLKPDRKKPTPRDALLAKYPWTPRLELEIGLDGGSDRPIPTNERGFIALGDAPVPVPGYPELLTNQYLYGLQEIVGWRNGVKSGKQISFAGRDPKNGAEMEDSLPGWERIRTLLQGSLPEVPLFAMPWLTHSIHARLAERRKSPAGEPARMDEELAFLDSKWNGFTLQVPYSKERLAVVQPIHALMTDRKGFFYRFPGSEQMAQAGDLPFIALQTYEQYAQAFLGQAIDGSEFIAGTPAAQAAGASFQSDCAYLSRYKTLIDQLVRAILCPTLRYPEYMVILDYPQDRAPVERKAEREFDVARKHALMVWAFVGKDPVKLADFLHEHVLDKDANRFPQNVSLATAFMGAVREMEPEMMKAIAARLAEERELGAAIGDSRYFPSDFEREFSPYSAYLDAKGQPKSDYLLHSFHALHERAAKVIQDAAYAVVLKELEK